MKRLFGSVPFLLLIFSLASAKELQVDPNGPNLVKFISHAPIEDFEGITDRIDGYVYWDDDDTLGKNEIYFEVDLNSIDTGIGLRNRHMRENYLETDRYPLAIFKGRIEKIRRAAPDSFLVTVAGTLTIHGVERELATSGTVTSENGRFHVHTEFSVDLPDFRIKIPKIMFLKLSKTVQLNLDFYLQPADEM